MFFLKCIKFYVDLENAMKFSEIIYGFEENSIWTCC